MRICSARNTSIYACPLWHCTRAKLFGSMATHCGILRKGRRTRMTPLAGLDCIDFGVLERKG